MERIVLRHLNGSKANQVEEFPLNHFKELTFGRDPSTTVKYDPDRDDLVGREHAKITQDPADATQFSVTDLNSRNGTYVNKQRIVGTAKIMPGDVIQFGAGGPEFQFDIEPRPAHLVRPTRVATGTVAEVAVSTVPQTREGSLEPALAAASASSEPAMATGSEMKKTGIGKATVERLLAQVKGESRKNLYIGAAAVLLVIAAVAAFLIIRSKKEAGGLEAKLQQQQQESSDELAKVAAGLDAVSERTSPMRPDEIAEAYSKAVVSISFSWRLVDTMNGSQVYHQFVPNMFKDAQGRVRQLVPDQPGQPAPKTIAAYIPIGNQLEPALGSDPNTGQAISSKGFGTGFVVTNDGYILTNRHVAAGWRIPYGAWKQPLPGVVIDPRTGSPMLDQQGSPILLTDRRQLPSWVPSDSKQAGTKFIASPNLEGKNDILNVTFPQTSNPKAATYITSSDRHDVALIKASLPEILPKLELYDNYDSAKQGDAVTVLGYPNTSAEEIGVIGTKTGPVMREPEVQLGKIPNPTLSAGYIGKILRSQDTPGRDRVVSMMGDVYQLTINTTGGGNSGGPVFDSFGRVIGLYTYGMGGYDYQVSGAVPIRYAKEIMGVTPVR